jgi:hypothetical protein
LGLLESIYDAFNIVAGTSDLKEAF